MSLMQPENLTRESLLGSIRYVEGLSAWSLSESSSTNTSVNGNVDGNSSSSSSSNLRREEDEEVGDSHRFPRSDFVIPIDKPARMTSADVTNVLRGILSEGKIGHTGTLDPMATGLLVCCVGRGATKQINQLIGLGKEYEGVIRLGETTPSYDADTEVVERKDCSHITDEMIEEARKKFVGVYEQTVPAFSAVHVEGERLYKSAHRGEAIEREKLPSRPVTIFDFLILHRDGPNLFFRAQVSKGTYIRSLAFDLGEELGVGAHLTELRRTAIGPFKISEAWTLERIAKLHGKDFDPNRQRRKDRFDSRGPRGKRHRKPSASSNPASCGSEKSSGTAGVESSEQ